MFNQLSDAEMERLALLSEECGEVVQVVGKILRHGYASQHPDDPGGANNRELLEMELGDLGAVVDLLWERLDISRSAVQKAKQKKLNNVGKYLHHQ